MKLFLFISFTFCLLATGNVQAQEAKAYEQIQYTARRQGLVFQLTYADGYLAASEIHFDKGKIKQVFVPEKGVPEDNGDLTFSAKTKSKALILLKNIDETATAPVSIRGCYKLNRQQIPLLFKRKKR